MNNKVSIIVPAFNAEKYISRTLDSILNQTYKNIEVIVIDDASTDKTKEIIKKYSSKDDRIIPFYSEINQGVSKTRNIGLRSFSGDFVIFVDADDYLTKDAVEIMVNASIKYKADIIDSYHLIIWSNKEKKHYFTENKIPKNNIEMGSLKENIEVLTKSTYVTGKLISKTLLNNLYFDENLRRYEDLVFEHHLKKSLKNMVFLNKTVYIYFQVSDSLINTLGLKHEVYLEAAKEVLDIYDDKDTRSRIESLLVTNAFLTGITKIVKNDLSLEENTEILFNYLNRFNDIFISFKTNKYINSFIKKYIIKLQNNKKKVKSLIKKTRKIDFIKLYFKYLSIRYKYKN